MDRNIRESAQAAGRYWSQGFEAIKRAVRQVEQGEQPGDAELAEFGEACTRLLSILADWRFREEVPAPPFNPKAPWRIGHPIGTVDDLEHVFRLLGERMMAGKPLCVNWPEVDKQAEQVRAWLEGLQVTIPSRQDIDTSLLTETQRAVFDLIEKNGPIAGKAICGSVGCEQSTLTRHIIPSLKRHGCPVKNKHGVGYFLDRAQ